LGKGHGIWNPFLERDTDNMMTKVNHHDDDHHNNKKEEEDDPPKCIYKSFKGLLKEWEQDLLE
jgi:hypothetical protein